MIEKICPRCKQPMEFRKRRYEGNEFMGFEENMTILKYYQCNDCKLRCFLSKKGNKWSWYV